MNIYVINGAAASGKDSFVHLCKKYAKPGRILNISTVDKVKEIAVNCGWDGTKTPENRKFLSDLKKLLTEWNDLPMKDIEHQITLFKRDFEAWDIPIEEGIIFIHCREPEEIARLVKKFNAQTILIRRPSAEKWEPSNPSDANVLNYKYDYVFWNDGDTFKKLDLAAKRFVELQPFDFS